jgi:RimJ/RimL family protein N-acetyltransferase
MRLQKTVHRITADGIDLNVARPARAVSPPVTIRKLFIREAPSVCAFFIALNPEDRYRRFCRPMTDPAIRAYTAQIDWSETVMLGAFNRNAELIGLLELCDAGPYAEIGLAVDSKYRKQGVAKALMNRALHEAAQSGKARVMLSCLKENIPMRRLARSAGLIAASGRPQVDEVELYNRAWIDRDSEATHEPAGNISYSAAL